MKLIIAYIQPEKLNDVKQALYSAEVYKNKSHFFISNIIFGFMF